MPQPHRLASRIVKSGKLCLLALVGGQLVLAGCSHFGNRTLEVTPAVFSECRGVNISVRVAWDATSAVSHGSVKLFVHTPGHLPSLWMQVAPKGEANTGKWVSDGWTITLVGDNHDVLATRTVQTTPCSPKGA